MNTLDLILLLPLALAAISGFRKGLVVEVFTFIGLVVAVIACIKITYIASEALKPWFENSAWLPILAYLLTFLGVFILIWLAGKSLQKMIEMAQLGLINRSLGAALSLLKACFMISLFFWLTGFVKFLPEETKNGSLFYNALNGFAPGILKWVSGFFPFLHDIIQKVEDYFLELADLHI